MPGVYMLNDTNLQRLCHRGCEITRNSLPDVKITKASIVFFLSGLCTSDRGHLIYNHVIFIPLNI